MPTIIINSHTFVQDARSNMDSVITPYVKQIWISSAVWWSMIGQGMVLGYTSCLLPALKAPDSPIKIDIHSTSWIASVNGFANAIGVLLSSVLMDRLGRRITFFIDVIPATIGWILIYFASNVPTLIVARILGGISGGATTVLGAIVIGEYTCPKIRGILLNLKTTAFCVGSMGVHTIGDYCSWRTVALIALIPHISALIITWTWVESPAWLASVKQYERSEKDFFLIRGNSEEAKKEFEELISAQKEQNCVHIHLGFFGKIMEFFKCFGRRNFIMPVIVGTSGVILFEACGRHIFPTYAKDIIGGLSSSETQGFYYILIIDIIITVCTTLSTIFIKIMDRRTVLFGSGIPASFVLLSLSIYIFLASNGTIAKNSLVTFGGLAIFVAIANMGCTLIPYVLIGEIFPLAYRGSGTTVGCLMASVFVMLSLKVTPYLLLTIKVYGLFSVMSAILILMMVLLYFLLPETKNRTLQQIEYYFTNGKFANNENNSDQNIRIKDI